MFDRLCLNLEQGGPRGLQFPVGVSWRFREFGLCVLAITHMERNCRERTILCVIAKGAPVVSVPGVDWILKSPVYFSIR